jgi:hypothetical protein
MTACPERWYHGLMRPARAPLIAATLALLGCTSGAGVGPLSLREVGVIPDPPGTSGRDVGFSVLFGGRSVWVFGDTFFADAAADGYHWRASTWSWTSDTDARDGLGGFTHALGADGKPRALLPHTAAEQAFDDAHNGTPCPAARGCGARHTVWPQAFVVDPSTGGALVFYSLVDTEPTGAYAFHAAGTSIATWASPDVPAVRPALRPELPDPTVMFPQGEPSWGAAALVVGTDLYAYACAGGNLTSPCLLARAPLASALDRTAWRFYTGAGWSASSRAAASLFDGAPLMSVHRSPYLGRFIAYYMVPLTGHMAFRTAPRPEGPWSTEQRFGEAAPALDGNWDYALIAHPELAGSGGRVEYLTYFQPGKFLDGTVHLVQVTYR